MMTLEISTTDQGYVHTFTDPEVGWASVSILSFSEWKDLGWDGTQDGVAPWVAARLWLRAEQDPGYRSLYGWDDPPVIS